MPKLTKQQRKEWSFFIHPKTGRIAYHPQCRVCIHSCKQSYRVTLLCEKQVSKRSVARAQECQNIAG